MNPLGASVLNYIPTFVFEKEREGERERERAKKRISSLRERERGKKRTKPICERIKRVGLLCPRGNGSLYSGLSRNR